MKHLLHFTDDGRIQPLWRPGTPWKDRRRLAAAYRAFVEGLDPQDRRGYFRFDVDDDGNAIIGGRATPPPGFVPQRLIDSIIDDLRRPRAIDRLLPEEDRL